MPITRTETEYHVVCNDETMAIIDGENAEAEAWSYASVYERDGEVKVYLVTKTYEPIG